MQNRKFHSKEMSDWDGENKTALVSDENKKNKKYMTKGRTLYLQAACLLFYNFEKIQTFEIK